MLSLKYINYNGIIQKSKGTFLSVNNRAFRYGDGLFETIRMFDGRLPFWDFHWKRLAAGAAYLQFDDLRDSNFYKKEIQKLCGSTGNFRIRLNLFRKDGGLYTPIDLGSDFIIEASALAQGRFSLNKKGLRIALCTSVNIPRHPISTFKTINSLPYVLAGLFKQQAQLDDSILLNDKKQLVEASSSNLFILKNKKLYTPNLKSGCKDGTMRSLIIQLAPQLGLSLRQKKLRVNDLQEADEIWLSNAIQGIRWVQYIQDHKLVSKQAKKMTKLLNQQIS